MSDLQIDMDFAPGLTERVDAYFLAMGLGVNTATLKRERYDILCWLNAKSDAELASLGTSRKEIPGFVFGDLFGS